MTGSAWTTADYALAISLFSAALAAASFCWNVWSKFIYPKPKLRVQASFVLFEAGHNKIHFFYASHPKLERIDAIELSMPAIMVTLANHGPGEVRVGVPVFARAKPNHPKREGYGEFRNLVSYPYQLLRDEDREKLDIPIGFGEQRSFYIPFRKDEFDEWKMQSVGFFDALGRGHFCKRVDIRAIDLAVSRYFAKVTP